MRTLRATRGAAIITGALAASAVMAGPASAARTPPSAPTPWVDHYTQGPHGTTVTTTTDQAGNPVFQTLATASVPFDWTIDFDSTLRARDMRSSDGVFCERVRSDYVQNATADPFVSIHLVKNKTGLPDDDLGAHHFALDGNVHSFCWSPHNSSDTYHFDFILPNNGYRVTAHGTAYH
jgi:hypothetical protein